MFVKGASFDKYEGGTSFPTLPAPPTAAPLVKVINDNFGGIIEGLMTTDATTAAENR